MDACPPSEMTIGLIEYISNVQINRPFAAKGNVVHVSWCNLCIQRTCALQIIKAEQSNSWLSGIGVESISCRQSRASWRALRPKPPTSWRNSSEKITAGRRAMASARVERASGPQTIGTPHLRKNKRDQMLPAIETLAVSVARMLVH